ncbi:MAG TPA: peptidoglycan recognition family protein [Dehalococcoidia bacterium]|nr:peptidoglycan recognition family protein [Dehalococcoidia bacterium]
MPLPFIRVGHNTVPLIGDAQCVEPFESKLEFIIGRDKCKARALDEVSLVTVHDTAGEGSGPAIYRTLKSRSVSVHFAIDRAGLIWQFCDPAVVTAFHMGPGNSRSIGIEIANAVFGGGVKPGLFANLRRYVLTGRERLYGRTVTIDEYRGRSRRVLGHFDAQKSALSGLVRTLLREFPTIPPRLPPRSLLVEPGPRPVGTRLDPAWRGVASHLHFSDAHVDCVGDAYETLLRDGIAFS